MFRYSGAVQQLFMLPVILEYTALFKPVILLWPNAFTDKIDTIYSNANNKNITIIYGQRLKAT